MRTIIQRVFLILLGTFPSTHSYASDAALTLETANPRLMGFINSAVKASPQVMAARASLDAAMAGEKAAAKPLFNPKISFDADNGETKDRVISLSQTLDWSNQREAKSEVALAGTIAVRAKFDFVQQQVASELLNGLSAYQTNKAREALARQRVTIMGDFASLSKSRFEQGDLNQVELNIASLAYVEARMRHADLQVELADAVAMVENVSPAIAPKNWPTLDFLQPLPAYKNTDLAAKIPNVLLAQNRANVALATIELRKRQNKPNPVLSLRGGSEGDDSLVGFGISVPIYLRNNFQAEVEVATLNYRAVREESDDIQRRALSALANTTLRYRLYYSAWRDWLATGLVDLNNQAEQLQALWEAGEISTTEFLLQIQQTLDTRESALILHQNTWTAWLDWLVSSGKITDWLELENLK